MLGEVQAAVGVALATDPAARAVRARLRQRRLHGGGEPGRRRRRRRALDSDFGPDFRELSGTITVTNQPISAAG
jgi:hypothetical protein